MIATVLRGLFVGLSLLDLILTAVLVERWGEGVEANLLAAALYRQLGVFGLVLLKALAVLAVLAVYRMATVSRRLACRQWLAQGVMVVACLTTGYAVVLGVVANTLS
jgi:hypothetical protein